MQSTNKVLCNFDQQLTELEKYTARANIGTFGIYAVSATEQSETVGSGSVNLVYTVGSALKVGVYLLTVNLRVDSGGTTPYDKAVPCFIHVDMNRSGGGVTPVSTFTNALTKEESSGNYELGMSVTLPVTITDATSFRFNFEFEIGKVPQGTVVKFNASGMLIGNIEPTP